VALKSVQRLCGAAVGTAAAALLSGAVPAGSRLAIVALFLVLAVGTWLRAFNYAYWAMCVTAALALLYDFYGEQGSDLLAHRLEGIVLGAAVGLAASWFVLPVRTTDVLRRRLADALADLTDVLTAAREHPERVPQHAGLFVDAEQRLRQIAAPLAAHRRLRRGGRAHPADVIDAVRDCVPPVRDIAALAITSSESFADRATARVGRAVLRDVVSIRRRLGGRPDQDQDQDQDIRRWMPESSLAAAYAQLGEAVAALREAAVALPRR
jgi:uncharacterized membrane protein YccC